MVPARIKLLRPLTLAALCLFSPAWAEDTPWGLMDARQKFTSTHAIDNHVCLIHDGWQIAFLSHNRKDIGAIFITEKEPGASHDLSIDELTQKLVDLIHMASPEKISLNSQQSPSAILFDSDIIESLGSEAGNIFHGSPLEGMSYLLREEYFYIHGLLPNGYLHWKTVKKSGVELLMPMAPAKLAAVEIIGRQRMDAFAAEVLARKLGLGSNTASAARRESVCEQLDANSVTYMNIKSNIVGAQHKRRYFMGHRHEVERMLSHDYDTTLHYPEQACDWPAPKPTPQPSPTPQEAKPKPVRPLTPEEARKAYIEHIRSLTPE